jgi:hypothetical protein
MKRIAPNPPSVNPKNQEKIDSRALIIQTLLPLGLEYAKNWLEEEVAELTGAKYVRDRNNANRRWGGQPGSIFLGDSKVKVSVPRVRDIAVNEEIPLRRYQVLQNRQTVDETALSKVLAGISCRDYKKLSVCPGRLFPGVTFGPASRNCRHCWTAGLMITISFRCSLTASGLETMG